MRQLVGGFALLCLLLVGCSADQSPLSQPKASAELQVYGGASVPWQSYRGQWVFINYWAEWCKPCLHEIPELNRLSQESRVAVLGVNYDGVAEPELQRLQAKFGIEFVMLQSDPASMLQVARPSVLPTTLVYTPQGQLLDTLLGPQTFDSLMAVMKKGAPGP